MQTVKFFLNFFLIRFFKILLHFFLLKNKKYKRFLVLDIDNTICDTWPHLDLYKSDRKLFYLSLPFFKNTLIYLKKKYNKCPIIFL